jgi:hypothetical protein
VGAIIIKRAKKDVKWVFKNNQDWRNIYVLPFKTMASWQVGPFSFI